MKIFICLNRISYAIASKYANTNKNELTIIFIDKNRINENILFRLNIFSRHSWFLKILYLISTTTSKIEVAIPHAKFGSLSKKITEKTKNLSLIDDGLDTYRENPKNLTLELINRIKIYYTFSSSIPTATWLTGKQVVKIGNIEDIISSNLPSFVTTPNSLLIIESPGINSNIATPSNIPSYYFTHPNHHKKNNIDLNCQEVHGRFFSLEKTMQQHLGPIYIGESMGLVFGLCNTKIREKLIPCLSLHSYNNLQCLHDLINHVTPQYQINEVSHVRCLQ